MRRLIIFALMLVTPLVLFSQNDSDGEDISLDKLEINNSPSLLLFDDAPTTMDRRNGGCAFVYNQYNGSNFSAAVSPYWYLNNNIKNRSALSYAGVVIKDGNSEEPEYRMSPLAGLKLITLSGAFITDNNKRLDASLNTFAVGAQANIISIYPKGHAQKIVDHHNSIKNLFFDLNEYLLDEYYESLHKKFKNEGVNSLTIDDSINAVIDQMKTSEGIKELEKNKQKKYLVNEIITKPMISVDGAVGYSMFFLDKNYNDRNPGRIGAWLTAQGSVPIGKDLGQSNSNASYINFYVLGKYLSDQMTMNANKEFVKQEFLDYGGKIEVELSRLSLGYEFIKRRSSFNTLNSNRSSGVLQVKVQDNLYLSTALGKSFGDEENLIALFGLNWNLQKSKQNISVD